MDNAILAHLKSWDIPILLIVGFKVVLESMPLTYYTHCQAHQLNLCLVKACSIPDVRNASGVVSDIAIFSNYSPKRQHLLEAIISHHAEGSKKASYRFV